MPGDLKEGRLRPAVGPHAARVKNSACGQNGGAAIFRAVRRVQTGGEYVKNLSQGLKRQGSSFKLQELGVEKGNS